MGVLTWSPGWSALTWDDFAKIEIAQNWAEHPVITPGLVWLPMPFWVYGSVFRLLGASFQSDPMAVVAVVNSVAVLAAAVLVGYTAWLMFGSRMGGLVAYTVALFSPWGYFTSLSGLSEPLYYLSVVAAGAAFVAWTQRRRISTLILGGVFAALAAATRYEAWWLVAAWVFLTAGPELWALRKPGWKLTRTTIIVASACVPLITPLAWFGLNVMQTGDPFHFARQAALAYESGYGNDLFDSVGERLLFYPVSLVRSAPLLLSVLVVLIWQLRKDPLVAGLSRMFGLAFGLFYLSTVFSSPVGIFSERYMFVFALALTPVLGGLPSLLARVDSKAVRRAVIVGGTLTAIAMAGYQIVNRPVEWTHAPDLLTLAEGLGEVSSQDRPLVIGLGPGTGVDVTPLKVRNGSDVIVAMVDADGLTAPGEGPEGIDVWIERLPARVQSAEVTPDAVVGRFYLYGARAVGINLDPMVGGDGWMRQNEDGSISPVPTSPYVGLEFLGEDPWPGAEALVRRSISRAGTIRSGRLELRSLYGHGFNAGRILVEVRVDGLVILQRDISERSQWLLVPFTIPAGSGNSNIEVAVVALDGIEVGWDWGRASTVLVRALEIDTG